MSGTLNGRTTHDPDCACTRCIGFQRGNGLAVTHGATRSDVALSRDPRVAELAQQIAETQPVSHPADAGRAGGSRSSIAASIFPRAPSTPPTRRFAEAPLAAYRDGADFLDRLREDHGRWLRLAGAIESDLARTPLSRSKLGLDVALARRALNVRDRPARRRGRGGVVTAARELLERYRADPVAFCREVLRFEPWSKQAEILESVRDHTRTAVRSCHAAGKTATAARIALWFLSVHPSSRVITTAPTWAQVRDLLWREIGLGYQAAGSFMGGELFDTRLELGTDATPPRGRE